MISSITNVIVNVLTTVITVMIVAAPVVMFWASPNRIAYRIRRVIDYNCYKILKMTHIVHKCAHKYTFTLNLRLLQHYSVLFNYLNL
jgi:hypothetical protein